MICALQEVEALFKSENCPKVLSAEFAHNSSWYITFQTDMDALQVCIFTELYYILYYYGNVNVAVISTAPGCSFKTQVASITLLVDFDRA